MSKSESEIESWLGEKVKDLGCLYYKFVSPGNRGVPDRIIVLPTGQVIFAELKAKKGVTSPIQIAQIKRMQAVGAVVHVVKGKEDAEDLVQRIRRYVAMVKQRGDRSWGLRRP